MDNLFGKELILDLKGCNDKILSEEQLNEYVVRLCDILDMKRYGACITPHFGHQSEKTSGYSVVQLIETSLISGHFSDKYKTAHINIFSCKEYDEVAAEKFTMTFFGGEVVGKWLVDRRMG